MANDGMTTKERMINARIRMYSKNPFFAYLVLNLKFKEFTKEEKKTLGQNCTMAVDNFGNLYYNPDWVDKLSDAEISGVLTHEVIHCGFEHLIREKQREHQLWNVAIDIATNNILVNNNFQLPESILIPSNNEIKLEGTKITIKDIDKKSAEAIYDEIYGKMPKKKQKELSESGFDEHRIADTKGKTEQQIKEIKESAKRWKELLVESATYSRQRGQIPAGMERQIDDLLNEKLNWKSILYRYITNSLPQDYSWAKPSKRSQATGIYMPYMKKEELSIIVSVDTSGSINQQELTEFMTEIVNLAKSFNNLKMQVIVCDAKVQETLEVSNGSIQKILDLKMRGGGGTSLIPIVQHIEDNYNNSKIWIHFTDGETDEVDVTEKPYHTLWILCKGGTDKILEKCGGEIIRLSE